MQNILCFGDSLTAGYGLRNAATESFPALIQQKINAGNLAYNVINAGLSGDTSAGGLSRIDYWLSRPIDVFILELGINDIMRGVHPQNTSKNLQAVIDKVRAKNPEVKMALMGMQIPLFIHSPFTAQFNSMYPSLANANQMLLVPFFLQGVAGQAHLNLADRLHPSAEGYKIIADKVWSVIQRLIV
ncbi:acyl-CoA thioesterase-1 [Mucilaginibacter frigoritolerans]|jgi:acyl-CoA thioesterase I|uniref:Acyl-CoA thioesterase-1 n=1 Tax=Mucilaginibacter frigoritolerans TaxID=652788 RepID=A0A562TYW9_9SPHI|nr:arylesterase [Mucilaginibacter frigoritolerans]TWI98812.1 acyl-CoA thioesterase-1 [Mucilaginibacter frigoritolerans]